MPGTGSGDSLFAGERNKKTSVRLLNRLHPKSYARWLPRVALLIVLCALMLRGLASLFSSALLAGLDGGCWHIILPLLMLLAARESFQRFAAVCLLAYIGRTALDVVSAVRGAVESGSSLGIGSLLYMSLSGLITPLLLLLLLGIGLQLIRLLRMKALPLYLCALGLAFAALALQQLSQLGITASLYGLGDLGFANSLSYVSRVAGGEFILSASLFTLFFWVDFIIRSGRLQAFAARLDANQKAAS